MKVLFAALHFGYFRNFESAICELADRGHRVTLVAEEPERFGGRELAERLAARYSNVSWTWAPSREDDAWLPVARKLRYSVEYVRFLDRRYADRPKLAQRAAERVPRGLLWVRRPLMTSWPGRSMIAAALLAADRLMPSSGRIEAFLREQDPDIVLLASLTYSRSEQADYLKVARQLRMPTVACIMGFDHLSSKALLSPAPDRIVVWNETQLREAVEMHRIPADRVAVTGAQCYDQWFGRGPSRSREEFCRAMGLPTDRPFVLYVCSAMSPDPHEARFVLEWIERIRTSSDARVREAGLLIRPHPERTREWDDVDLSRWKDVVLSGRNPIDPEAKADYFDALHHSTAVVGIVTSAFLEAAIAGRPVYTIQAPEFRLHQDGAPHFHHLVRVEGGLLIVARDLDEHLSQMSEAVADRNSHADQTQRFLTAFVRPHGLERPATEYFVRAVEDLAHVAPEPAPNGKLSHRLLAPLVRRVALTAANGFLEPLMRDADEVVIARNEAENFRHKQRYIRSREKQERKILQERDARLRRKEKQRRAKERRRRRGRRTPAKVIAHLKGRLKQLIGPEVR